MRQQIEQRLKELRTEFETGQKALADIELRQTNLRSTLLRISGAIQVLEEELGKSNVNAGDAIARSYQKPGIPVETSTESDDGKGDA